MSFWQSMQAAYRRVFHPRPVLGVATGAPLRQDMSTHQAMSFLIQNPWVMVCVKAKAGDLAGLPLRAVLTEGGVERILPTHPTLELLKRPAPRCSGLRLRRQVYADFELSGNAYLRQPSQNLLLRMNPALTTPYASSIGLINGYSYGPATGPTISADEVLHIADISWTSKANEVLGESAARALRADVRASLLATQHTAKAATRGRPEFLMSPKNPEEPIGDTGARKVRDSFSRGLSENHGVMVVGDAFDVVPLNLTPRDLEFDKMDTRTRDRILAVFQVPPARAGLTSANYGTQKQQMRTYWEALLHGAGALFDEEFSRLTGSDNVRIEHDASDVESLQLSRTERQMRAATWVMTFGADPAKAAAFEGFPNAPIGVPGVNPRRPAREPDEPQRKLAGVLHTALQHAAIRYQSRILATDGNADAVHASTDEEALHLLKHLEGAGVPAGRALHFAGEVAALTAEAVAQVCEDANERGTVRIGIENMQAFSPARAARLAKTITEEVAA